MSKIKLLINEVFRQAEDESGKTSKNGLASYLNVHLETHKIFLNERTFVRYYDAFVLGIKKEINPDPDTLNKLSKYLGYRDFADFSRTFVKKDEKLNKTTVKISVDEDEESMSEKFSKLIINITNEQHFKMPDFIKKNGVGILEMAFVLLFVTGGVVFPNTKSNSQNSTTPSMLTLWGKPDTDKKYMYWDGEMYIPTNSTDVGPEFNVVAIDLYKVKHFKRITRKDTMTVENSVGRTWYSKYNGDVQFFTADGVDPDNGRELRKSTDFIITKYAGPNTDSLVAE
ncbi:hypothetical protein [Chryseobacterium daeguense]|uniref:hypothetical protein n=1 Tax=Chryseobacterium daeguense TaxID=412438 RepID=UPI0004163914|nr:hypothetical protein [Chryseobacterium daeguense]